MQTNRNAYAKQTAQDIVIGGDFILKEMKRIINSKTHISVHDKRLNNKVNITPNSFSKICSQNEQNTEATIMNLFEFNYPNKGNSTKQVYDSLLSGPYKSQEVHILDSNDLDPEVQYNLLHSSVKKRATKEINPIILDLFHHDTIARNYTWIIMQWKIMHAIFLLITSALAIHLSYLIKGIYSEDFLYPLIGIMLALINYSISIISLCDITADMPYKACDSSINYPLMIGIILSAIELNIIPETIPQNLIDYLEHNTYYRLLHHMIILLIVALLIVNFKIKEFFNEYNDRLPVKHSLIPDRIEEDQFDTDTEEYDYLNHHSQNKYTQLI